MINELEFEEIKMITTIIILVFSLVVLAKSAQVVINNSVKLSDFFGLSQMSVGFLLIAVVTSLPELSIALASSITDSAALSLGDILGSNLINMGLVLGLMAVLTRKLSTTKHNIPTINKILLLVLIFPVALFAMKSAGAIVGVLLIVLFLFFSYSILKSNVNLQSTESKIRKKEALYAFIYFVVGMVLILLSSSFTVDSSITLAKMIGVSGGFIGATLIALGTSLPELAVNLIAIKHKRFELAIGNIIGSCFINVTLVAGVLLLLNTIVFDLTLLSILSFFTILMSITLYISINTKKSINTYEGLALLFLYVLFMITMLGFHSVG